VSAQHSLCDGGLTGGDPLRVLMAGQLRPRVEGQWLLKIVDLEGQTYDMPLGWKISQTTFEIVRWMLGEPKLCNRSSDKRYLPNEDTVERNSCVLKWVADLLRRK
jgi:hypothetical protein